MGFRGLLRLFHGKADPVDLVLKHYYHGASGWDTARFDAEILSVQYGTAGDVIAAGDSDGRIHLICTQTGAKILCLKDHSNWVWTVAFSFDGKVLASGGNDRRIILWDPKKGERLKTLEGHSDGVLCVVWAPDGSKLVSGGGYGDNKIKLWSPSTGECLNTLEGHSSQVNGVSFSADGSLVASCSGSPYLRGARGGDCSVRMWSVETGHEAQEVPGAQWRSLVRGMGARWLEARQRRRI